MKNIASLHGTMPSTLVQRGALQKLPAARRTGRRDTVAAAGRESVASCVITGSPLRPKTSVRIGAMLASAKDDVFADLLDEHPAAGPIDAAGVPDFEPRKFEELQGGVAEESEEDVLGFLGDVAGASAETCMEPPRPGDRQFDAFSCQATSGRYRTDLPKSNPYVGSFHRGGAAKRPQPDEHPGHTLPAHNPYVGSFHRGGRAKKKKMTKHASAEADNFVQQFLPLGMMMAATKKHSLRPPTAAL
jgi:hypothetical protein